MKKNTFFSRLYELISSMRFAVTLFVVLMIASVIGTVLKQNEPYPNYLVEFGAFWFDAWRVLGLYDVYHAVWFLVVCGFLVLSTSICIVRHAPGFIREMQSYRLRARRLSLINIQHHHVWSSETESSVLARRAEAVLASLGYRSKVNVQEGRHLVAAKKGTGQRLGYFLAHIAIVLICLGGLIDGNLPYQIQSWLGLKQEELRELPQSQVPAISRLSSSNLSFRGNVNLSEGQAADVVFLSTARGYLVQELPFVIELKQFYIEHYSTGQPKRFASDIVVTSKVTGKKTSATIEVNKPLTVDGVTIYQASFGDGGSPVVLQILGDGPAQTLASKSQKTELLNLQGGAYSLELGDFRLFNIEPLAGVAQPEPLQRAMMVRQPKQVENVGPSISYKLRNNRGQAQEFQSYMSPVAIAGRHYWVTGVRDEVGAAFQFLRVPLDEQQSSQHFMALKALLQRTDAQEQIAPILVDQLLGPKREGPLREPFREMTLRVIRTFNEGGFPAVEQLVNNAKLGPQSQSVMEMHFKILMGFAAQAELMLAREKQEAPPAWSEEKNLFLLEALQAMSDWKVMRVPALVELKSFTNVKSSGLQLTRSPGKILVYLGSLMLIVGTFIMFYIRERRVFIHLQAQEVILAMTFTRKNADSESDFEYLKTYLPQWLEESLDDRPH